MKAASLAFVLAVSFLVAAAPAHASFPIRLRDLHHTVTVLQDVDGIPHIRARDEHDLFFVLGWLHARDRLFEMDVFRRQASGTLAELLGPGALESDVELRTLGLRRAAERSQPLLSDATLAALDAYAAGVNAYASRHPLPPEYKALELTTFEPWTPLDTITVSKLFAFERSFDSIDLDLTVALQTYQQVGAAATPPFDGAALFFQDVFRVAPFDDVATIPDASATPAAPGVTAAPAAPRALAAGPAVAAKTPTIDPAAAHLAGRYLDAIKDIPAFHGALAQHTEGSNEFAVAGEHTASGRALVANDPHLSLNAPSFFYMVHLEAPPAGFDVSGVTLPGEPYVIQGQNRRIAWGSTTLPLDTVDFYQEQVVPDDSSPSGLSTVYLGQQEPVIPIPETFRYNVPGDGTPDHIAVQPPGGGIPQAVLIVPRRNQGPIVELDQAAGAALSLQYTGSSGTRELDAFRTWNLARNVDDFQKGLLKFDFGQQNWAYADTKGNIAYFTSAEVPVREDLQAGTVNGLPPFFVRNGTGGNEWLSVQHPQPFQAIPYEILPADEMPHIINPPAGFFVNSNNDPDGRCFDNNPLNQLRPGGGISYLNVGFDLGIRAYRITDQLKARLAHNSVTPGDMMDIQADVVMHDAQVFTPYILTAFDDAGLPNANPLLAAIAADPRVAEAVERLRNWDQSTPTGVVEGYDAIDVDGTRLDPTSEEVQNSIAPTIYSVWRGQILRNTVDGVLDYLGTAAGIPDFPKPADRQAMTALRHLLDTFDTNQGVGASGLNFFNVPGVNDPAARRDIVLLKSLQDALNLLAGDAFAAAFHHSENQDDYRWGRLHRVVLEHPLDSNFNIPPAAGFFPPSFEDLPGLATDGGYETIDAATHSVRANSANEFMFDAGPARRYVGEGRRRGMEAETSLAGGESGVPGDRHYVDLLGPWLTNDTFPVRTSLIDIFRGLESIQLFLPKRKPHGPFHH
jgi:penicillin amidase